MNELLDIETNEFITKAIEFNQSSNNTNLTIIDNYFQSFRKNKSTNCQICLNIFNKYINNELNSLSNITIHGLLLFTSQTIVYICKHTTDINLIDLLFHLLNQLIDRNIINNLSDKIIQQICLSISYLIVKSFHVTNYLLINFLCNKNLTNHLIISIISYIPDSYRYILEKLKSKNKYSSNKTNITNQLIQSAILIDIINYFFIIIQSYSNDIFNYSNHYSLIKCMIEWIGITPFTEIYIWFSNNYYIISYLINYIELLTTQLKSIQSIKQIYITDLPSEIIELNLLAIDFFTVINKTISNPSIESAEVDKIYYITLHENQLIISYIQRILYLYTQLIIEILNQLSNQVTIQLNEFELTELFVYWFIDNITDLIVPIFPFIYCPSIGPPLIEWFNYLLILSQKFISTHEYFELTLPLVIELVKQSELFLPNDLTNYISNPTSNYINSYIYNYITNQPVEKIVKEILNYSIITSSFTKRTLSDISLTSINDTNEILTNYRKWLREQIRELSNHLTNQTTNYITIYLINQNINYLSNYISNPTSALLSEVEVWLHSCTSINRPSYRSISFDVLTSYTNLLTNDFIVNNRDFSRLVVIILSDIFIDNCIENKIVIPSDRLIDSQVVNSINYLPIQLVRRIYQTLLSSILHPEMLVNDTNSYQSNYLMNYLSIYFRIKQNHIGCVSLVKALPYLANYLSIYQSKLTTDYLINHPTINPSIYSKININNNLSSYLLAISIKIIHIVEYLKNYFSNCKKIEFNQLVETIYLSTSHEWFDIYLPILSLLIYLPNHMISYPNSLDWSSYLLIYQSIYSTISYNQVDIVIVYLVIPICLSIYLLSYASNNLTNDETNYLLNEVIRKMLNNRQADTYIDSIIYITNYLSTNLSINKLFELLYQSIDSLIIIYLSIPSTDRLIDIWFDLIVHIVLPTLDRSVHISTYLTIYSSICQISGLLLPIYTTMRLSNESNIQLTNYLTNISNYLSNICYFVLTDSLIDKQLTNQSNGQIDTLITNKLIQIDAAVNLLALLIRSVDELDIHRFDLLVNNIHSLVLDNQILASLSNQLVDCKVYDKYLSSLLGYWIELIRLSDLLPSFPTNYPTNYQNISLTNHSTIYTFHNLSVHLYNQPDSYISNQPFNQLVNIELLSETLVNIASYSLRYLIYRNHFLLLSTYSKQLVILSQLLGDVKCNSLEVDIDKSINMISIVSPIDGSILNSYVDVLQARASPQSATNNLPEYLRSNRVGVQLLGCLFIYLLGGSPPDMRDDVIKVIKKAYITLGIDLCSDLIYQSFSVYKINELVSIKELSNTFNQQQFVKQLYGYTLINDWNQFRNKLKNLAKSSLDRSTDK